MKVLLTGGGGFLGGHIASRLVGAGHEVRSFSRGRYPNLDQLGVQHVRGDLGQRHEVIDACQGCDAVIHTAAKAGVWGHYGDYFRTNVEGTRNVLAACRAHQIGRLVYTSTPSVVHSGGDIEGADESLPYTSHPLTHYQATKTQAEQEVFDAGSDSFAVVALRPHLIWGPGDPHLVPRIISRVRRGRILLPGGGDKRVDTVFIDNAAEAHVAAIEKLGPGAACAGKAYFVTNGEPMRLSEIVLGILSAAGVEARVVAIPKGLSQTVGGLLERIFTVAGAEREPPLTRFVARQLSTAHWFSIAAASRDLDWRPTIKFAEGLERLRQHFVNTEAGSPQS